MIPTGSNSKGVRSELGLVSRQEYAEATGRKIRSLKRDWTFRRGPRPIRIGQQVFYRVKDIEAYIESLAK
jgi:hypothetical protein